MASPNIESLMRFIRFQLSQLGARNGHHEFEHLARHFARLRIAERIIPATGPVSAGGDHGRDFETYRTYLSSTPIAHSTFLTRAKDKTIVFACSLMKGIEQKIRSDVKTICGGDQGVDEIVFFCEMDLPIGKQIKLKKYCKEKFSVDLTIFDGQGIAENLTDVETFWIAQQYLSVPSELYPKVERAPDWYQAARRKWIEEAAAPASYADFFEIKSALRRSTFNKRYRSDLLSWIQAIEKLLEAPVPLKRRAMYEICVAALRGLNALPSYKMLASEYFAGITGNYSIAELTDAVILLSYCSTAVLQSHFDEDPAILHAYTVNLVKVLDEQLRHATSARRCELLAIRGHAEALWFRSGTAPKLDSGGMFSFWEQMLRLVPNSPLFPLESFSDRLTALAPHFSGNPRFDAITAETDDLLAKRAGNHTVAEKCRDRAVSLLDSGNVLQAVRQLHTSKVKWFTAETLRGSLLSILTLSDAYLGLGLVFAAKYYAAAAAFMAYHSSDDHVKDLFPASIRQYFNVTYAAGEWLTCLKVAELVFRSHTAFDRDLYDFDKYGDLASVVAHLTVLRHICKLSSPRLSARLEQQFACLPVHADIRQEFDDLAKSTAKKWAQFSEEEVLSMAETDLWGRPFLDLGRDRRIEWRALGIHWIVTFSNDFETVILCEEFLSILQIMIAELGATDLLLLPTVVRLEMYLTPQDRITTEQPPGNDTAYWRVGLPRNWLGDVRRPADAIPTAHALAATILGTCSALSKNDFESRIHTAFEQGLFDKTNVVASYQTICRDLTSADEFDRKMREQFSPLFDGRAFAVREARELAWISTDGPGYSIERSQEMIRNRYRRSIVPIRFTLPRVLQDPSVCAKIQTMRNSGMRDWEVLQILANRAIGYRSDMSNVHSPADFRRQANSMMSREELESDAPIPLEEFSDENLDFQTLTSASSIAGTWGLHLHRQTPDMKGLRRLLVHRYHIERDDVEHDNLFGSS